MNTYTIDLVDIAQRGLELAGQRSDAALDASSRSVMSFAVAQLHRRRVDVPGALQPHVARVRSALI